MLSEMYATRAGVRATLAGVVATLMVTAGAESVSGDAAIAYDPATGRWGYSFGHDSTSAADDDARRRCGEGCYAVEWARGTCAALANRPNEPSRFATSTGHRTQWDAMQAALWDCGDDCEVQVWVCDDKPR